MPRIRCHYEDCIFLEDGYCGAAAIELEPEAGCLTYTRVDEAEDKVADDLEDEDEFEDELEDEAEDYYDDEDEDETWEDED
ncbi:MAG: hypothetical protein ABI847_10545 [Anaerolineales bacterium]